MFPRIEIPKKVSRSLIIAQAAKTITSPTRAAVIWFLAVSVFALSPPEVIHLIPPITRMKKKTTAATIKIKLTNPPMIVPTVRVLRLLKPVWVGFKLICANIA